jgi:hypothetical protein
MPKRKINSSYGFAWPRHKVGCIQERFPNSDALRPISPCFLLFILMTQSEWHRLAPLDQAALPFCSFSHCFKPFTRSESTQQKCWKEQTNHEIKCSGSVLLRHSFQFVQPGLEIHAVCEFKGIGWNLANSELGTGQAVEES